MKEIFVQFPTYEVAQAFNDELSKTIGDFVSSTGEQQRLVAILLALKDMGVVNSHDRGEEAWFFLDPKENEANDVLQIKMEEPAMSQSVNLSERIMPTLMQMWQDRSGKPEFELDPFISQLALYINREITKKQPEFKVIDLAERVSQICLSLHENGVAIRTDTDGKLGWVTAETVDLRIGGSKISHNKQFSVSSCANITLCFQFRNAVRQHLKRRLASMLETSEAMFQLCNMGMVKISNIDRDGHYLWTLDGEKLGAGVDGRRKGKKSSR
jgi:hypothetical protein